MVEEIIDDQDTDTVGTDPQNEGRKSNPKSKESLSFDTLDKAIKEAIVRQFSIRACLHLLELGLDVIRWQRDRGANNSGQDGGDDSGSEVPLPVPHLEDQLLELVEGGHLTDVDAHGSQDGRSGSSPERYNSLFLDDSSEGVEDVLVASPLLRWESEIRLESDKSDV